VVLPTIPVAGASIVPPSLAKHYFLVTEQNDGGAAQYDVDVYVNSKWCGSPQRNEQIVLDITRFLSPGANKLLFAAPSGRPRRRGDELRAFIVGEGDRPGRRS